MAQFSLRNLVIFGIVAVYSASGVLRNGSKFAIFDTVTSANNEAPYIKVCKQSDPNIASCIIDSVNKLRPKLKEGIPELNVPPIEPLLLDEVKLRSGPSSAKIDANITNIKVWGPSSFEVLELKPNIAKTKFAFKARIPFIHFEGDYDIDMSLLLLKYKGVGPISGNFTNYSFDCILKGNKIMKEGVQHIEFQRMLLRLNIGTSQIKLKNLFRDDPIIAKATAEVLNDNTDIFINEIRPNLEQALSLKFTEIANQITRTFSYNELFP